MDMYVYLRDEVVVIKFKGEFGSRHLPQVSQIFEKYISATCANVIVNMAEVEAIQPVALALFARGSEYCRQFGGSMYLCGMNVNVFRTLETSRFANEFEVYESDSEALRHMNKGKTMLLNQRGAVR